MPATTRFTVAVHALTCLALSDGALLTSEALAESISTNPVVVRRVVSALGKAGLVESYAGSSGGSRLARKPERISLLAVHEAVESEEARPLYHRPPSKDCPVGKCMEGVLRGYIDKVESAREKALRSMTLGDIVRDIRSEIAARA